jgi:hypothetical protein
MAASNYSKFMILCHAIHMTNLVLNNTPNMQDTEKCTTQQMFDATNTNINPKHWKPFGCPIYVLHNALRQGTLHHKWKQRS